MLTLDLRPMQRGRLDPAAVTDQKVIKLLQRCPIIKTLNLTGCATITDQALSGIRYLNRLRSVSIQGCSSLSAESLKQICRLRLLECLNISDIYHIQDQDLRHVLRATRLESLTARNTEHFTDSTLTDLCTRLTLLQKLDISYCRRVSSKGLANISNLKNLGSLTISGITRVDQFVFESFSHLPKLERLTMRTVLSSSNLTSSFARYALPHLSSLTRLDLGFCVLNNRFYAALSKLSELQRLEITNQSNAVAEQFSSLTHIRDLIFSHSIIPVGALKQLKKLERLNIDFCTLLAQTKDVEGDGGETRSKVKTALSGIRKILSLTNISAVSSQIDDTMLRSISACTRLRHLELGSAPKLSLSGLNRITKLEKLIRIDFSNNSELDDKVVASLAPHLNQLEEISLANCESISDTSAETISFFCPFLKNAVFFHTKLTDDGVRSLARLKHLLLLDISGCHKTTISSVIFLRSLSPRCHVNAVHLNLAEEEEVRSGSCAIS